MTLRLMLQMEKAGAALALHGWLSGAEVAEFERLAATVELPLRIDLAHLVSADAAGLAALRAQTARGACLDNVSPYIALLLKSEPDEPEDRDPGAKRNRPSHA
jgi:hypothetical protein